MLFLQFFRRLWQGFLTLCYALPTFVKVSGLQKDKAKLAFIDKSCGGEGTPYHIWNLFKCGFWSEGGIEPKHLITDNDGKFKVGDPYPRNARLAPFTFAFDSSTSTTSTQPGSAEVTLGEVVDSFGGLPVVLNFGSIT